MEFYFVNELEITLFVSYSSERVLFNRKAIEGSKLI